MTSERLCGRKCTRTRRTPLHQAHGPRGHAEQGSAGSRWTGGECMNIITVFLLPSFKALFCSGLIQAHRGAAAEREHQTSPEH